MFRRNKQTLQAGLSFADQHLTVTLIDGRGDSYELVDAVQLDSGGERTVDEQLRQVKKQFKLNKIPCVCAMEPGSYSLLQIEAPNVNSDELKSALRWKIKDLIDFHIDDATIDLFEMPASERSGSTKMLNVVVARTTVVRERVDTLHAADIEPIAIDITELALRNIGRIGVDAGASPVAMMFMLPENVYIEIADSQLLYLSRNIETNLDQLSAPDKSDFAGWGDTSGYEMLSLEMQRSMDYYESHYGQGPAREMRIYQKPGDDNEFIDFARDQLSFNISTQSLADTIAGIEQIESANMPSYLPAIGAALRV